MVEEPTAPAIEPPFAPWRAVPLAAAIRRLPTHDRRTSRPGPTVVAVDGRSGAGKTTFATALARTLPGSAVVHTDDVAWHHSFFDWQGPMIDHVLAPVRAGRDVSWRPEPWVERGRQGRIDVPASCRWLVVEGVGASRDALAPYLDARVWVAGDASVARAREIERDGDAPGTLAFIEEWARAERAFLVARRPWERADLVVCGTPEVPVPDGHVMVHEPPRPSA